MEIIVFCISIGMIMMCSAFGLGVSIGRTLKGKKDDEGN